MCNTIVTFINTHEAIKAESEAKKVDMKFNVIPTPTQISKSCGISLKVDEENMPKIYELIEADKIVYKNIYYKNENNEIEVIK